MGVLSDGDDGVEPWGLGKGNRAQWATAGRQVWRYDLAHRGKYSGVLGSTQVRPVDNPFYGILPV